MIRSEAQCGKTHASLCGQGYEITTVEACEAAALQAGAKRISSLQSGVVITPRPRPPPGLKRNRTKRAKPDVTQLDE